MRKAWQLIFMFGFWYSCNSSGQEVMTWVSSGFISESKTILADSFGGISVKSAISRVGLQFWNISSKGTVSLSNSTPADVQWFGDWGKLNNVKILLTAINYGLAEHSYNGFDWTLVRAACYGSRGDTLIGNLLAEVDKYNLDGIDLDFEGEDGQGGPFTQTDNLNYSVFVNKLCDSIHSRGKLCTIDSYPGNLYGAPKPDWWTSWKEKIDAIHTMGYTSTYWNQPTDMSYQAQQNLALKAGIKPGKVLMGLPMWVDKWAGTNNNTGTSNIENLNFILNCLQHQTGIALWDIHTPVDVISGTNIHPWTADTVWRLIKAIHDGRVPDSSRCPALQLSEKIIDNLSNTGVNLKGGLWNAFSDYFSRSAADQANSTKVLSANRSFDLALQYGTYGDIAPGYSIDPTNGPEIKCIVKTISKVGTDAAEGGLTQNFLPVDPSIDPSAQPWEIAKIGVERDLSAYNKLIVGAQCSSGKQIRIFLRSKTQLASYAAGYGDYFNCTGNFKDYELPFASLTPVWGAGPAGFDATHCLQLTVEFVDPSPPNELSLNIAGIGVDTSVLSFKHIIATQSTQNKFTREIYQLRKDGIYFNSSRETSVAIYSIDGRLICSTKFNADHFNWLLGFVAGIYIIRFQRESNVFVEKFIISR